MNDLKNVNNLLVDSGVHTSVQCWRLIEVQGSSAEAAVFFGYVFLYSIQLHLKHHAAVTFPSEHFCLLRPLLALAASLSVSVVDVHIGQVSFKKSTSHESQTFFQNHLAKDHKVFFTFFSLYITKVEKFKCHKMQCSYFFISLIYPMKHHKCLYLILK